MPEYCDHNRVPPKCWECHMQRAVDAEARVAALEEADRLAAARLKNAARTISAQRMMRRTAKGPSAGTEALLVAAEARVAELEDENHRLEGQWLDGGSHPEDIEAGTRVHYYPIRGDSEYLAGKTRTKPVMNVDGLWMVDVDLDDGYTMYSAHIRHLRREPAEARLRARVAALKAELEADQDPHGYKMKWSNLRDRVEELVADKKRVKVLTANAVRSGAALVTALGEERDEALSRVAELDALLHTSADLCSSALDRVVVAEDALAEMKDAQRGEGGSDG